MTNELTEQTPYYVRVYHNGGCFDQKTFAHFRDAKKYALDRRSAGWLRSEIDIGDMWDGSRNVSL